jgi:hypothetical protein
MDQSEKDQTAEALKRYFFVAADLAMLPQSVVAAPEKLND